MIYFICSVIPVSYVLYSTIQAHFSKSQKEKTKDQLKPLVTSGKKIKESPCFMIHLLYILQFRCTFVNFRKNKKCLECSTPRPHRSDVADMENIIPGDWRCPEYVLPCIFTCMLCVVIELLFDYFSAYVTDAIL